MTTTAPPGGDSDRALQAFVDGFASPPRSPVFHSPSEHGLDYEDVTFLALDGIPIEAWFIPAPGSGKVIIANPKALRVCPLNRHKFETSSSRRDDLSFGVEDR